MLLLTVSLNDFYTFDLDFDISYELELCLLRILLLVLLQLVMNYIEVNYQRFVSNQQNRCNDHQVLLKYFHHIVHTK